MTVVQSIASARGAGAPDAEHERATTGAAQFLPGSEPPDSALLSCLSILAGLLERPISTKALRAGLPLVDEQFTPDLFIREAQVSLRRSHAGNRQKASTVVVLGNPGRLLAGLLSRDTRLGGRQFVRAG